MKNLFKNFILIKYFFKKLKSLLNFIFFIFCLIKQFQH